MEDNANELRAKLANELRGIFNDCTLPTFIRNDIPRTEQILRERLAKVYNVLLNNDIKTVV